MKSPIERRTAVYQLGAERIRNRRKHIRNAVYCSLCVIFICSAVFISHYITTMNNVNDSLQIGYNNSPIESIEINGNGIKKKISDRPTVTQISICIKDMIKGDYTYANELSEVYTVTFVYKDKHKTVFQLTKDGIVIDERYYSVDKESYNKLLNYFK